MELAFDFVRLAKNFGSVICRVTLGEASGDWGLRKASGLFNDNQQKGVSQLEGLT